MPTRITVCVATSQRRSILRAARSPSLCSTASLAEPFIEAGFAAFKTRRFAQAEIEFRKAVEVDPRSTAARFYLGYTEGMMWVMGSRGGGKPLRANQKPPGTPARATVQGTTPSTGTAPPAEQEAAALVAKAYELDMAVWTASPAVASSRMTLKNGSVLSLLPTRSGSAAASCARRNRPRIDRPVPSG